MGWCSATEIFDSVADYVIDAGGIDRLGLLIDLAKALEDQDWDCQEDSKYRAHPIFKRVMHKLHPDWDAYRESEDS